MECLIKHNDKYINTSFDKSTEPLSSFILYKEDADIYKISIPSSEYTFLSILSKRNNISFSNLDEDKILKVKFENGCLKILNHKKGSYLAYSQAKKFYVDYREFKGFELEECSNFGLTFPVLENIDNLIPVTKSAEFGALLVYHQAKPGWLYYTANNFAKKFGLVYTYIHGLGTIFTKYRISEKEVDILKNDTGSDAYHTLLGRILGYICPLNPVKAQIEDRFLAKFKNNDSIVFTELCLNRMITKDEFLKIVNLSYLNNVIQLYNENITLNIEFEDKEVDLLTPPLEYENIKKWGKIREYARRDMNNLIKTKKSYKGEYLIMHDGEYINTSFKKTKQAESSFIFYNVPLAGKEDIYKIGLPSGIHTYLCNIVEEGIRFTEIVSEKDNVTCLTLDFNEGVFNVVDYDKDGNNLYLSYSNEDESFIFTSEPDNRFLITESPDFGLTLPMIDMQLFENEDPKDIINTICVYHQARPAYSIFIDSETFVRDSKLGNLFMTQVNKMNENQATIITKYKISEIDINTLGKDNYGSKILLYKKLGYLSNNEAGSSKYKAIFTNLYSENCSSSLLTKDEYKELSNIDYIKKLMILYFGDQNFVELEFKDRGKEEGKEV